MPISPTPPIKLADLKGIATIVKSNYAHIMHEMHFVFGVKTKRGTFLIFQELFGAPIERFVYHEANNSITFVAAWSSWTNPNSLVADANGEMIENYRDLLDRSRPYNAKLTSVGAFNSTQWTSVNRQNKKEKRKKHKNKVDTFFEFRIEGIEKAVFSKWGMELYSSVLSMVAVHHRTWFPYYIDGVDDVDGGGVVDSGVHHPIPILGQPVLEFKWSGKTFDVNASVSTCPSVIYHIPENEPQNSRLSYWEKADCDVENEVFDEDIADILLDDRNNDDEILDVGQRDIDLLL